jgi:ribose transport system ATP-binding protein
LYAGGIAELLEADRISKHFGGVAALRNARFALRAGEVHALIGENGAGKSTLAKILAGSVRAESGTIRINGEPAAIRSPRDAQRLGIGIIYQELDLFPHLSAGENIVIGNQNFPETGLVNFRRIEAFCRPFLEQVGLQCGVRTPAARLAIGQMQLLAIARALSLNARIILMDEPTSSLFDDAVEKLFQLIRELKERGVSVVYVSHKMDEIFRVCDRATVLRDGETIGTVEIAGTTADDIIRMMVGREWKASERAERASAGEVLLEGDALTTGKLRGVSFVLRRGEVLGVAGLVGSGRSELGAALFGIDRLRSGGIRLKGRRLEARSPGEAMRNGIGLVPEDRRLEGLMMSMSVMENGTIAALSRMQRLGFVSGGRERAALDGMTRRLALKYASRDAVVETLSGGNQQKVLLGRWLLLEPDVLFLDDPARGIDVGAKHDLYRLIDELARAGKGVILVSSELPELLRCADRIIVLSGGRLIAEYDREEATQEKIMASAANAGGAPEGAG